MTRVRRAVVIGVMATALAGCGDSSSPSAPTAAPPTASTAPTTWSVQGTISEVTATGLSPLAGAQVTAAGITVSTNAQGAYSLLNLVEPLPLDVTASRAGYKSETRTVRAPPVTPTSALFDMEIVRESDIHILSGTVSELTSPGRLVPVQGVMLAEMSCNAVSRGCLYNVLQNATTDNEGHYRFTGLYAGKNNFVWVTRDGYDVVDAPPMPSCDNCNAVVPLSGDTRVDFRIVRR
jgi:hypothetical protein